MKDLYMEGKFAKFFQLKEKFDLPSMHFFRYLQLRNNVCTSILQFELLTDENEVCKLLFASSNALNLISRFMGVFTSQLLLTQGTN